MKAERKLDTEHSFATTKSEVKQEKIAAIVPVTNMHSNVIDLMQMLGYGVESDGVCLGFSSKMVDAFLTGNIDTFNRRLNLINELTEFYLKEKNNFSDIDKKSNEKIRDMFYQKLKTSNKKVGFSKVDQNDYVDILAFFDGIAIYQLPGIAQRIMGKSRNEYTENLQHQVIVPLPITMSAALEKMGGIAAVGSFSGVYNRDELTAHFRSLHEMLTESSTPMYYPISLMLGSANHAMMIGYDPKKNVWLFGDVNQAKISEIDIANYHILADKVISSFSDNQISVSDIAIFQTEIFVDKTHKKSAQDNLDKWRSLAEWQVCHLVTKSKAKISDSFSSTWLMTAVNSEDLNLVQSLLDHGADPNQVNSEGQFPLLLPCLMNNIPMVKVLLDYGADPNQCVNQGRTLLINAIQNNQLELVEVLLNKGAQSNQLIGDYPPIYFAIKSGNLKMVTLLLEHNADVNQLIGGISPLMFSLEMGDASIVKALLAKQPSLNTGLDKNGNTALTLAVQKNDFGLVQLLLKLGADPNFPDEITNIGSPLHCAAKLGNLKIVNLLLGQGANPDKLNLQNKSSSDFAKANNHVGIANQIMNVSALYSLSAKIDALSAEPNTARFKAVERMKQFFEQEPIDINLLPTMITAYESLVKIDQQAQEIVERVQKIPDKTLSNKLLSSLALQIDKAYVAFSKESKGNYAVINQDLVTAYDNARNATNLGLFGNKMNRARKLVEKNDPQIVLNSSKNSKPHA